MTHHQKMFLKLLTYMKFYMGNETPENHFGFSCRMTAKSYAKFKFNIPF